MTQLLARHLASALSQPKPSIKKFAKAFGKLKSGSISRKGTPSRGT